VFKKEAENFFKIQRSYDGKTARVESKKKVIPATIGAIGTYTKSLRKYLKKYRETTKSRKNRKQPY